MGFHGFHQRISGLIYEDVRGVLQVFLAHAVLAAVLFSAPVGRRTGTGFTLGFLPGFPAGFKTVQQVSTSAGFTLCFTPGFAAGFLIGIEPHHGVSHRVSQQVFTLL